MRKYTNEEILFIKENYNKLSRIEMSLKIGRSVGSIRSVLRKFNLKNTKLEILNKQVIFNRKRSGEFTVDETLFINNINPTTSYLLGLLWADGYLSIKRESGYIKKCRIILSLIKSDGEYIKTVLDKTGKWSFWINNSGENPQYTFHCANTILCDFLEKNDYTKKSAVSPTKILNHIPKNLHKHFILGYLDGDGCVYAKGNDFRITFTSTIEQDWGFLENVCKDLNCKYSLKRVVRTNRNSKYSHFSIYGKKNCVKFGKDLFDNPNLGFERKRKKYQIIYSY